MAEDDKADRFERFYREHASAVFAYATARGSRELAEEAVEETFLVAWRRFDELPAEPRAWLLGVARRVLSHQYRARGRRQALGLRIIAERAAEHVGADPAVEVSERDLTLAALARLPKADREVLCLLAWGGLSPEQAAKAVGCTVPTLRVRLHRARRRFEAALSAEEVNPLAGLRAGPAPARLSTSPISSLVPKEQLP